MTTASHLNRDLRWKLMFREAVTRLEDAEIVSPNVLSGRSSDSHYLLSLLAFELFLKLAYEISTNQVARRDHDYAKIFGNIPQSDRDELLRLACERIDSAALFGSIVSVLGELGKNFVGLRYPFENYENLTEPEYIARGIAWAKNVWQLSDATFRYFPEELYGLTHALRTFILQRCAFINDPVAAA